MDRPDLLAEVNETIRRIGSDNGLSSRLEWVFVCECGGEGCTEHVALEMERYDEIREARAPVLARGHVRAETRRRAAELRAESLALRSDAAALQAQAQHQQRRAARLAGGPGWARLEFRCAECGHEACGRTPPRSCPTCQGTRWHMLPLPAR